MSELPKTGLYVATKNDEEMRLVVESVYEGEAGDPYFLEYIEEADKDDSMGMGYEASQEEWETLVSEHGLVHQPD